MSQQELSPIERYRAAWKPDEVAIAEYESLYENAVREGNFFDMVLYFEAWTAANTPPRNLPIKNLSNLQP